MARMLGFSEEEKHQVRLAQESARGGVVRGVFSLPSRLVGGIPHTAASHESPLPARIENQVHGNNIHCCKLPPFRFFSHPCCDVIVVCHIVLHQML